MNIKNSEKPLAKDILCKAELLLENELLIVKYQISPDNIGKIQLSNSVLLLSTENLKELKVVLKYIEKYSTNWYKVPKQNSKP